MHFLIKLFVWRLKSIWFIKRNSLSSRVTAFLLLALRLPSKPFSIWRIVFLNIGSGHVTHVLRALGCFAVTQAASLSSRTSLLRLTTTCPPRCPLLSCLLTAPCPAAFLGVSSAQALFPPCDFSVLSPLWTLCFLSSHFSHSFGLSWSFISPVISDHTTSVNLSALLSW